MDSIVFQAALLKVRERKVEQSIATQHSADCAFQDIADLVVENFGGVRILVEESLIRKLYLSSSFS